MRIVIPNDIGLLTGINNGRSYASRQDPDVPKEITLVVSNSNTLITQSWFKGFLERYFELGINVTLETSSEENKTEFNNAIKRLIVESKLEQSEAVLKEASLKLQRTFAGNNDFKQLVKDTGAGEFLLADFFEAKSGGKGLVELEEDVDRHYHRTLNRAQLAAVIVSLIDLSLGE